MTITTGPELCGEACQFCYEFAGSAPMQSRIIYKENGFVLLPTVGCFVHGYCLVMPLRHVRSFADLAADELEFAANFAERMRALVVDEFGPSIIAEHGPGSPGAPSSACCDHAHWHIIPTNLAEVSHEYERVGGPPLILKEAQELRQYGGQSYLYLSPMRFVRWVWRDSPAFGHQFARITCARTLKMEDLHDWAVFQFRENMHATQLRLTEAVNGLTEEPERVSRL